MKLSSRKIDRGKTIELSMTSMIDVVFLLLIFFMTTSAFIHTERELPSGIRVKKKSAVRAQSDLEPAIVEIVRSGDRFVYKLGTRKIDSREELTNLLRLFQNKADGAFVRAGDDAPFDMAAAAIQACKSANFPTVSYVPLYRAN
jgi:biopolymer transport protein ExbD